MLLIVFMIGAVFALITGSGVSALYSQVGAEQVTLNPGGGLEANGSDGMRFTINSAQTYNGVDYAVAGGDSVVYKNTYQYCCSAGGPMLNIGGTLFGQAGPANGNNTAAWSSITIMSTSGTASVGTRTSAKGNASVVIRYTVVKGGLTYIVDRQMSYVYPNDFVTDSYTFTIPTGNTDVVKFYLGGDTAPGSSDQGKGVMLTSPVRSIISLNPSSRIMFGFRESPGSKAFDGATSQHYSAPYGTVVAGGNIGFVGTVGVHDAGLMMQWNLGTTPGTQTASLEQFVTGQGTNLNASFSVGKTKPNVAATLSVSIANTNDSPEDELAYIFTLPNGLVIAPGAQTNSCNGTVVATAGTGVVTLDDGEVGALTNCVVSVPVVSPTLGTYTISSTSATGITDINNNVGTSSLVVTSDSDADGILDSVEDDAPNNGDGNNDGVVDSEQLHVTSLLSSITGKYSTLVTDSSCELQDVSMKRATELGADSGYEYPLGLFDFTANCGSPGFTTTITQYFYDAPTSNFILRKYANGAYQTINDAAISQEEIGGRSVLVVTYQVTDGGPLDADGVVNGVIVDPAGPATVQVPGAPNTGVGGVAVGLQLAASLTILTVMLASVLYYSYGIKAKT